MNEQEAVELFEIARWGNKPICPRCQSNNVCKVKSSVGGRNKRFLWRCHNCKKQFTVRIGTKFENSRVPFSKWIPAIVKKMNAFQIHRYLNISYKSALYMVHRIEYNGKNSTKN
jgi:transposase-like protein